jgi:hypothetical protein
VRSAKRSKLGGEISDVVADVVFGDERAESLEIRWDAKMKSVDEKASQVIMSSIHIEIRSASLETKESNICRNNSEAEGDEDDEEIVAEEMDDKDEGDDEDEVKLVRVKSWRR